MKAVKEHHLYLSKDQLNGVTTELKKELDVKVSGLMKDVVEKVNKEKNWFERANYKKEEKLMKEINRVSENITNYHENKAKTIAFLLENLLTVVWIAMGFAFGAVMICALAIYAYDMIKMGDWKTLKGLCVLGVSTGAFGFLVWFVNKLLYNLTFWRN